MAISRSAKKRIRQTDRRSAINRTHLTRARTYLRRVEEAIAGGDKGAAETALNTAMPVLHRGVRKGVMHRNTVARKLSRLATRIKAL